MSAAAGSVAFSPLDAPLWVIVPAAGSGQRLGGEVAKQYRVLDGVMMLRRTLNRLLECPHVAGLVVVISCDDKHWHSLAEDAGQTLDARVQTTFGGQTRAESVLAGIRHVSRVTRAKAWLMVHDAARPLIALSDIARLINAVSNSGSEGALLATPVHDTLKRTEDGSTVQGSVERSGLWQAQTPQLFRGEALQRALENALNTHAHRITDEASAMELAGFAPLLVEALEPNFKITRPVDWTMATALLRAERLANQV